MKYDFNGLLVPWLKQQQSAIDQAYAALSGPACVTAEHEDARNALDEVAMDVRAMLEVVSAEQKLTKDSFRQELAALLGTAVGKAAVTPAEAVDSLALQMATISEHHDLPFQAARDALERRLNTAHDGQVIAAVQGAVRGEKGS